MAQPAYVTCKVKVREWLGPLELEPYEPVTVKVYEPAGVPALVLWGEMELVLPPPRLPPLPPQLTAVSMASSSAARALHPTLAHNLPGRTTRC